MILFPAIDILNKRSVRLLYGDYNKVTDYGLPVEMAIKFYLEGARFLHLVDLDGAREGKTINGEVIGEIAKNVKIPIQLGGGIRSLDDISRVLDLGVSRAILGTICLTDLSVVEKAIKKFGAEKIACTIDEKNDFVCVKGWKENSNVKADELAFSLGRIGVRYIVHTDILKDGALTGASIDKTEVLSKKTELSFIVSGGIASLQDIKKVKEKGIYGAILGRALYEKKFKLSEALMV